MQTRLWIGRSFWTGAVLAFVALLSLTVALVLRAVGDHTGFGGVWGVFLVSALAWTVNFVTLVALLAWRTIQESPDDAA